ncbi:MAG: hypothetical protein IJ113_02120 [Eggerthellaceae bacterium]|nr:hypothetical protein [Eggerthellaceae bacterium]
MEKGQQLDLFELEESIIHEDISRQYEILHSAFLVDCSDETIQKILVMVEKHLNVDYGVPGPIVFFIEDCYKEIPLKKYEQFVINALFLHPSPVVISLLGRLINKSYYEGITLDREITDAIKLVLSKGVLHGSLDNELRNLLHQAEIRRMFDASQEE